MTTQAELDEQDREYADGWGIDPANPPKQTAPGSTKQQAARMKRPMVSGVDADGKTFERPAFDLEMPPEAQSAGR